MAEATALASKHQIRPLPFQPARLKGLSERTYWSGNHTQACAFGQPLLVLDMYEHSYALDYGAAAAKYVDAFFQNVNWDEVERRLEAAGKAAEDLRR